jgi:hypothetical protein
MGLQKRCRCYPVVKLVASTWGSKFDFMPGTREQKLYLKACLNALFPFIPDDYV